MLHLQLRADFIQRACLRSIGDDHLAAGILQQGFYSAGPQQRTARHHHDAARGGGQYAASSSKTIRQDGRDFVAFFQTAIQPGVGEFAYLGMQLRESAGAPVANQRLALWANARVVGEPGGKWSGAFTDCMDLCATRRLAFLCLGFCGGFCAPVSAGSSGRPVAVATTVALTKSSPSCRGAHGCHRCAHAF